MPGVKLRLHGQCFVSGVMGSREEGIPREVLQGAEHSKRSDFFVWGFFFFQLRKKKELDGIKAQIKL